MTNPQGENAGNGKGKIIQTALEPAAKEFAVASKGAGKDLGDAVALGAKSVKALLSPLKLVIWGYEQIEDKFIPEVERKLEGLPEDRRMEPSLVISGPTVEALRFAGQTSELREMFANLLATAIDADTAKNAHPSFVDIIKQLSPDEARILKHMDKCKTVPLIDVNRYKQGTSTFSPVLQNFCLLGSEASLEHTELVAEYMDNLCRLGICEIPYGMRLTTPGVYNPLENAREIKELLAQENVAEGFEVKTDQSVLGLTAFGIQFVNACVSSRDALPPSAEPE